MNYIEILVILCIVFILKYNTHNTILEFMVLTKETLDEIYSNMKSLQNQIDKNRDALIDLTDALKYMNNDEALEQTMKSHLDLVDTVRQIGKKTNKISEDLYRISEQTGTNT